MNSGETQANIRKQKNAAGTAAKHILAGIPKDKRKSAADRACALLKATEAWQNAQCVLLYLAFGSELNADPLIKAALKENKKVYAPRITDKNMEFRRLNDCNGPFETGPFGIRQPQASAPLWDFLSAAGPSLIIVPGLAFDKRGGRLGRGGGYYDRFLSRVRQEAAAADKTAPLRIGYGYAEQIMESVPMDAHDECLDGMVTDLEIIFISDTRDT